MNTMNLFTIFTSFNIKIRSSNVNQKKMGTRNYLIFLLKLFYHSRYNEAFYFGNSFTNLHFLCLDLLPRLLQSHLPLLDTVCLLLLHHFHPQGNDSVLKLRKKQGVRAHFCIKSLLSSLNKVI